MRYCVVARSLHAGRVVCPGAVQLGVPCRMQMTGAAGAGRAIKRSLSRIICREGPSSPQSCAEFCLANRQAGAVYRARELSDASEANSFKSTIDQFRLDHGFWPPLPTGFTKLYSTQH